MRVIGEHDTSGDGAEVPPAPRRGISPERYRQIAIGALLALCVIIVTGAAVRLTNSGLGCEDWPRCSSTKLVDVSSKHAAIEQLNRFFTGVVGAAVIAAVLASHRRRPYRRDLTILAWLLVAGVVANAVLGGISVKVDLHPLAVQGHMVLSMLLVIAGTILVVRAGEPDGVPHAPAVTDTTRRLVWAHFALTCAAVLTGTLVTGAGPHAGDESAERLDVAIETVARVHGVTVMITIALAVAIAWRVMRAPSDDGAVRHSLSTWIVLGVLQAAVGYIQYFNDVPALLVGIHVAGATAVMWAATALLLDTRAVVTQSPHAHA
jgi:cytochrome c oxidase assembly protein subunit 15